MADYTLEPWGDERADLRAGSIVQATLQPHSKKPITLKECVLQFIEDEPMSEDKMMEMMKQLTLDMGGKVIE